MNIKGLEERVQLFSLIAKKHKLSSCGRGIMRVDPCPVCGHKDHFTVYPDTNSYTSFSGCCKGGSVYQYLQEVEGLTADEAYQSMIKMAGVESKLKAINWDDQIKIMCNKQNDKDKAFFLNRGVTEALIKKHSLCIGDVSLLKVGIYGRRAILPVKNDQGYIIDWSARSLESKSSTSYIRGGTGAHFFNEAILSRLKPGTLVVLTEGEFDSLSLEAIGVFTIGLRSLKNEGVFIEIARKDLIYVTGYDNDEPGLKQRGKYALDIPEEFNDLNEWYIEDPLGFEMSVLKQLEQIRLIAVSEERSDALKIIVNHSYSLGSYMSADFKSEFAAYQESSNRKTGFVRFDHLMGGLYPGLYVLGAASSMGKTTFVLQIAQQMANLGEHVIFISLEQRRVELMMKCIRRINPEQTAHWAQEKWINGGIDVVKQAGDRLTILERKDLDFNTGSIVTIRKVVDDYFKNTGHYPVVMIDYLQIIKTHQTNRREGIDDLVNGLKEIQSDRNLLMFVISSIGRSSYISPINMESFKESGGIEYAADVLMGLQPICMNEPLFKQQHHIEERHQRIDDVKRAIIREMELVIIKSRNGAILDPIALSYDTANDNFKEMIQLIKTDLKTKRI